jgi:hypothetical protein
MKDAILKPKATVLGAEGPEVFCRFGHHVRSQLDVKMVQLKVDAMPATSHRTSITMRPAGLLPMLSSIKTLGLSDRFFFADGSCEASHLRVSRGDNFIEASHRHATSPLWLTPASSS